MSSLTLTQKIVILHESLRHAGLAHAFGGALALAYCTKEPRGTRDIDINIFVSPEERVLVEKGLVDQIVMSDRNRRELDRDGQSRLWWDDTPIDVFLSNHPFHDQVEQNVLGVPFADIEDLPVLACHDLAVFKTFFGRPKDAIDIAAMIAASAVELEQLKRDVSRLLGDSTQRAEFLALVESAI